jgi:hypothetical protein
LDTCSAFPCKVCLIRVSQVKGSVHSWELTVRVGGDGRLLEIPCRDLVKLPGLCYRVITNTDSTP